MTELIINPKFRDKIPSLTFEEFEQLEKNIVEAGVVFNPIIVWNKTIIDGHHRWKVIQKHPEVKYTVKEMDFENEWAAISWMCKNQLGRRNLTEIQKELLVGEQYRAEQMLHGGNRGNQYTKVARDQNDLLAKKATNNATRKRVAKETGTNEPFVQRSAYMLKSLEEADELVPGFREKVVSGEITAPKSTLRAIYKQPDETKRAFIEAIERGENPIQKAEQLTDGADFKPVPIATPVQQSAPYNLEDFKDELEHAPKALRDCLSGTLRIHPEMLNTKTGKKYLRAVLEEVQSIVDEYWERTTE